MDKNKIINTKEEAIDYAIEWQAWQSTQSLYMSELVEWQNIFEDLAKRVAMFPLGGSMTTAGEAQEEAKTKKKATKKVKRVFTQKEFDILFDALDVFATEVYDSRYEGEVDTYGTKRQVKAKLEAIGKLEKKLNTL